MHAVMAHRDAVRDRDGAELQRIAAGRMYSVLRRFGQPIKRQVAWGDLVPARRDADLRLRPVLIAHTDCAQHAT